MSPTTKRICRIAVTLRPDKVYTITLDHCIENLVPQRLTGYLIPLVRYYWGFDKGTKLEYEEFGESLKKIIKEELEKKNHDLNRVGYAALCSSAPYILEDACNYAKNTLVL